MSASPPAPPILTAPPLPAFTDLGGSLNVPSHSHASKDEFLKSSFKQAGQRFRRFLIYLSLLLFLWFIFAPVIRAARRVRLTEPVCVRVLETSPRSRVPLWDSRIEDIQLHLNRIDRRLQRLELSHKPRRENVHHSSSPSSAAQQSQVRRRLSAASSRPEMDSRIRIHHRKNEQSNDS